MSFGERLQSLRKKKGMSQEQLAQQLHVSRQAVSKWETGESLPDTDKVILLANFFGVTMDYLLNEQSGSEPEQENAHNESWSCRKNKDHNFLDKILEVIKRKGYVAGYIISFYGVLALGLTRFAYFSFKSMLLPQGFDIVITDLPTTMKIPLYFSNILSIFALLIILFGLGLAVYLKRKK